MVEDERVVDLKSLVKDKQEIKEIVFASLSDMRTALRELSCGKSIIGVYSVENQLKAEVIPNTITSLIQDGKCNVSAITSADEVKKEKIK